MFYDKEIQGTLVQGDKTYSCDKIREYTDEIIKILHVVEIVNEDSILALALPRNIYLISAIFASLECGITFLPLDMEQPRERINYMLEFAKVRTVLSLSNNQFDFEECNVIYLDNYKYNKSIVPDDIKNEKNQIAYILYTSGTTGNPKAVEVTRIGFANFLDAIPSLIEFNKEKRLSSFTSSTFDIFFLETILALYEGVYVFLADEEEHNNPKKMIKILNRYSINMIQMTPSHLKMIQVIDKDFECLKHIETIMLGGEKLPYELLKELKSKTSAKIYNMYGPTETTIWSTVSELTNKDKVDIGHPIKETTIYLLTDKLQTVREGEIGEICIGGIGLAKGYLMNKVQTDKCFCRLQFFPYEKIYRTGDLGMYDRDGDLICLGRKDEQIKLRGHRIELEDIDANLMRMNTIKSVVTCFEQETEKLISFYISNKEIEDEIFQIHMESLVPRYMIPIKFIKADSFCYTVSNKIDRKEMLRKYSALKQDKYECDNSEGSKDEITEIIIRIIKGIICDETLVVTEVSSMFELEINSISYISIIIELEDEFDLEFEDEKLTITAFNSIEAIADYIKIIRSN